MRATSSSEMLWIPTPPTVNPTSTTLRCTTPPGTPWRACSGEPEDVMCTFLRECHGNACFSNLWNVYQNDCKFSAALFLFFHLYVSVPSVSPHCHLLAVLRNGACWDQEGRGPILRPFFISLIIGCCVARPLQSDKITGGFSQLKKMKWQLT